MERLTVFVAIVILHAFLREEWVHNVWLLLVEIQARR